MSVTKISLNQHFLIIGGGLLGLSSAKALLERGARVTLIEKDQIGRGCSFGNAGWLTPCFALPLPQPGLFWSSIKWLLDSESPLYIQPRMSATLAQWLFRFLGAMNLKHLHASTEVLVQMSNRTLELIQGLRLNPELDFRQKGLLMVSATRAGLTSTLEEMHLVARYGVQGQQLSVEELRKLEPALIGPLSGGVYFPNEAQIEPYELCLELRRSVEKLGGKIIENREVTGATFTTTLKTRAIESLQTHDGPIAADHYVFATGSWSKSLGKSLGLKIPVLGGKGYSMIVPPYAEQPHLPIMVLERKIAITPRNDGVRLAGTLELVHEDFSINPKRSRAIFNGSREFIRLPANAQMGEIWRGLRPCAPDGMPIVGPSSCVPNLSFNTGHQMLGLQTSLGSGELLAQILQNDAPESVTERISPQRFQI